MSLTQAAGSTETKPPARSIHSVTRILGATAPEATTKSPGEAWLKSPGAAETSRMASTRGTLAHDSCEYLAQSGHLGWRDQQQISAASSRWAKMAFIAARRRSQSGALKKHWLERRQSPGAPLATPEVCADGSSTHVTAVHSSGVLWQTSLRSFAGACDALIDLSTAKAQSRLIGRRQANPPTRTWTHFGGLQPSGLARIPSWCAI